MEKLIEWNKELSVNIEEIDEQHKILLDIINELFNALQQGKARFMLANTLNRLTDYTLFHFQKEEEYFIQHNYILADEHKAQHLFFIEALDKLKQRFAQGDIIVSFEIMTMLKEWLQNHIKQSDKKFFAGL